MEVHAHAHTARKKWTHYFWEFLMLFLAVFCGFIAENYREHKVEEHRAKLLASNLYKEILADSVIVQQKIDIRKKKEEECSYFIRYVKDSSLSQLSPDFFYSFTWAFIQTAQLLFEPNDGIVNQLRNSGELRYFKNSAFQAAIGDLSVQIANVRTRNDKEYSFLEYNIRPFTLKHYDFDWYEKLTDNGKLPLLKALESKPPMPYTGKLINPATFDRQEAQNIASYYLLMLRGTRNSQYGSYVTSSHVLLEILRKEYHID